MNASSSQLSAVPSSQRELPPTLAQLSADQRQRLTSILDRYMVAQEQGAPLERQTLLDENPDLADVLRLYFASLDNLQAMAGGLPGVPLAEESMSSSTGGRSRRLGDFELIREIGRGGMGVVYEARQISLQRRVALKLLPFAAMLDAKQIARFKHEALAAAQLHHEHIVPVYAVGVERGIHYYAMQFIDGLSLDDAIVHLRGGWRPALARHSCLARAASSRKEYFCTVARLGIQAARALHAAHEYGVIHRDVKPSNLLLEADGKLWVTDFGLARFQHDLSLTKTGDVVGTMRYMSPEQAAGQPALVDQRTDVYSLGVTLYELLCLRAAFPEENGPALLRQIDHHAPPPPRQIQPEIPADLENVVLKAMARAREDRYATAQQLADDLACVLEGRPTVAKPPALATRFVRWTRRHQRAVAAGVAMLLLAVIGSAVSTLLICREKSRAEENMARADQYWRDTREVLDRFGVQLTDRLAAVPGAEQVRRDLLSETRDYYQKMVAKTVGDRAPDAELAQVYRKIATLTDEVGSAEEAVEAHRRSLQLFQALVAAEPDRLEHARNLGLSHNNLALALHRGGRLSESQEHFGEAIRVQEQLAAQSPDDDNLSADLASSRNNLGLLKAESGNEPAARESFLASIDAWKNALAANSSEPQLLRKMAATYNNLASTYLNADSGEAIRWHRQALDLQIDAAKANPDDLALHRDVALTYNNLGAACLRTSDTDEAFRCYEQAIRIQDELAQRFPAQTSLQIDLAISHNNLGLVHSRVGRTGDAEVDFRRALAIHDRLAELLPDDLAVNSNRGGVYNNLGIALEQANQLESSAAAFAQAVAFQRAALDRAPQVMRIREFLDRHYANRGRVLRRLGQLDESVAAALARHKLWPGQPKKLFLAAEELAAICTQAQEQAAPSAARERYAELAVQMLRQAVEAGYSLPADLARRTPFNSLADSAQLTELTCGLRADE